MSSSIFRNKPARCPVCNARWDGGDRCPRCGADLSLLVQTISHAQHLLQRAIQEFNLSNFTQSKRLAQKSVNIKSSDTAQKLIILSDLFLGNYSDALRRYWVVGVA